ncbi:MAG: hypothetical protein MMC33_010096 [Icmadophila ericetorum]|nr:hypothetical protein [Icmadophila ericetorum]
MAAQVHSQSAMDNLARLASKPGVQSTLILSKVDGAIISSLGRISSTSFSESSPPTVQSTTRENGHIGHYDSKASYNRREDETTKSAQDIANLVFSFVSAAGGLAQALEEGNDAQLLRLRTRRNEIVVVPGKVVA